MSRAQLLPLAAEPELRAGACAAQSGGVAARTPAGLSWGSLLAAVTLAAGMAVAAAAAPWAPPPAPVRWVTDNAGFLSPGARASLDEGLAAYSRQTGHQVLVWIDSSTGGVPVEDFTVRSFAAWRVGRKGIDDGLVLFVFPGDRKARFEVGYGLEDKVPDAIASRILNEVFIPRLQAGDRDGAVTSAISAAITAVSGSQGSQGGAVPGLATDLAPGAPAGYGAPARRGPGAGLSLLQKVLLGIVGLIVLFFLITHPSFALYLLVNILSSGRGGGGFSGGGGGGGGGFSGGGGRSGGGGATGSW